MLKDPLNTWYESSFQQASEQRELKMHQEVEEEQGTSGIDITVSM